MFKLTRKYQTSIAILLSSLMLWINPGNMGSVLRDKNFSVVLPNPESLQTLIANEYGDIRNRLPSSVYGTGNYDLSIPNSLIRGGDKEQLDA